MALPSDFAGPQLVPSAAEKNCMNLTTAPLPSWMFRLVSRRPAVAASSQMHTRIEVCPPELWPSSISWRSRFNRLGQCLRSHALPWMPIDAKPVNRLALVKAEFQDSLSDIHLHSTELLLDQIERARSLRELWHLRSPVYGEVATGHTQAEAELRLARLNRHFPMRAPRSGLSATAS